MASALLVGSLVVTACEDAFFFAPASTTPVSVSFSFNETISSTADAAGPGEAFDKATSAHVVLELNGSEIHSEDVTLETVGQDKQFTLNLELGDQAITPTLFFDLMNGSDVVFVGQTTLTLTPGQPASTDVPLNPVFSDVGIIGAPNALRVSLPTQLPPVLGTFSTGDQTEVSATWVAISNATVTPSGVVTALGTGSGLVRADFAGGSVQVPFTGVDPCSVQPDGNISTGQTVNEALSRVEDCDNPHGNFPGKVFDTYTFSLGSTQLFNFAMATDGFAPVMRTETADGGTLFSAVSASGPSMTREHLYPAGSYRVLATSLDEGSSLADAPEGNYTLSMNSVGEAQSGCITTTIIRPGVSTSANITSDDCLDDFNPQPSITRRWDGYALRGDGSGNTVSVTASGNFVPSLSRWRGGSFVEVINHIPTGETARLFVPSQADVYDYFYVLNFPHDQTGSYTFSIDPGDQTGLPNLVAGQYTHPDKVAPLGSFTLDLEVLNLGGAAGPGFSVSVYIAAQPSLNGPQAFLGSMNGPSGLQNGATHIFQQTFSIPSGVNGPHFIVVEVDGGGAISESNEDNIFGLGPMNVAN